MQSIQVSPSHRLAAIGVVGLLAGSACGQAPQPPSTDLYQIPYAAFPLPVDNQPTPERLELGRLIFFDPVLSANHKIACGTCHQPQVAMTDGLPVGAALSDPDGGDLPRASPTIYNVRFQHVQFWDGRATSLEDLALKPIQNPKEMGNTVTRHCPIFAPFRSTRSASQTPTVAWMPRRCSGPSPASSPVTATRAPVDRYLQGDTGAMSVEAIAGFNLYFGKARCSRCHYVPLFAGTEGPDFAQTQFRVTGVPDQGDGPRHLTTDLGRGGVMGVDPEPSNQHAFKAPTLRNIAHTAPYMHNGVFATLEQVVDFYDKGAGPGQGYDVPNLDPVMLQGPIGLTRDEKATLLTFLREGLTDLSSTPQLPDAVPSGLIPGGVPRKP